MTNIETPRRDGTVYHGVQIGASDVYPGKQSAQMVGHFKKAGVATKRHVKEFEVSSDAHVPVGRLAAYFIQMIWTRANIPRGLV